MAENENTFLNADHIYEDVEGEQGKTLKLEEDQSKGLVGLIKTRFSNAERARLGDERDGYLPIKTFEVSMVRKLDLGNLKSLEYLLKLPRLKLLQPLVS